MFDPNARVITVMNASVAQLVKFRRVVTPETQYQIVRDWYLAWMSVATTPDDMELLTALEIAHDRLFCNIMDIRI